MAVFLVVALAFHWAAVGLIGLSVMVLATAFAGITEEHRLGHAFQEALPFTALLVVFFAIVAVIHDQDLFLPIANGVLSLPREVQAPMFFVANGLLSAISDNVFVATVYINEIAQALESGSIDREQFDALAVAINTGTNIPSVATPNGQAAFLFLLTSALAPLIRLSYMRMVVMRGTPPSTRRTKDQRMATKSTTKTTPDTVKTRIGDLQYERGFPTEETTHKVFDEIDYQRAVQAYLWAYPALCSSRSGLPPRPGLWI